MMEIINYIEIDGVPVPATGLEWARWFGTADRTVARDIVGDAEISTVFIGIDHNFTGKGPPLLYETMVFTVDGVPPILTHDVRRYHTRTEALAGHKRIVATIITELPTRKETL